MAKGFSTTRRASVSSSRTMAAPTFSCIAACRKPWPWHCTERISTPTPLHPSPPHPTHTTHRTAPHRTTPHPTNPTQPIQPNQSNPTKPTFGFRQRRGGPTPQGGGPCAVLRGRGQPHRPHEGAAGCRRHWRRQAPREGQRRGMGRNHTGTNGRQMDRRCGHAPAGDLWSTMFKGVPESFTHIVKWLVLVHANAMPNG